MELTDRLNRPLRDLRISVTDRCNFRCRYCMPRELFGAGHAFLPRAEILDFEEIERVARLATVLGVRKIRLTGGEPLLRRELDRLVARLARVPGIEDLTLTTNGVLLPGQAQALRDAGLGRVTVSLDAIEDPVFQAVTDVGAQVDEVLAGITAAEGAGLTPIKINAVIQKGMNEDQILPLARHFRHSGHILRFVEFMDVGNSNGWRMGKVVTAAEIRDRIASRWALAPLDPNYPGEVASRYRYTDGAGEIGLITSVTQPFCRSCTRARLTAPGVLYNCLFAGDGLDLRQPLRSGASDRELNALLARNWQGRGDRYSEIRTQYTSNPPRKVEMSHIGG